MEKSFSHTSRFTAANMGPSSSDPSLRLRRSRSLKSAHVLRHAPHSDYSVQDSARAPVDEAPVDPGLSTTLPTIIERPKKSRKAKLRKRLSLTRSTSEKRTDAMMESVRSAIAESQAPTKISIGDNVAFSHKQHVGKDDANQFLMRLLKMREERYMEMHQKIRENITAGYVHLRPPNHMAQKFAAIVSSNDTSFRRRIKKGPKQNSTSRAYQFWVELVPQRVGPSTSLIDDHDPPEGPSEVASPRTHKKKKRLSLSRDSKEQLNKEGPPSTTHTDNILKKRYEEIVYFPENLPNSTDKRRFESMAHASAFQPKGAPDYMFYVFANENQTHISQLLAVIPLSDVKVTPISPIEFSVTYINRLPNSHCFQCKTPQLMNSWLKTLELATQRDIPNPFEFERSRSSSLSHGLSALKDSLTIPLPRRRKEGAPSPGPTSQRDENEHYYKYVCWDVSELKAEGGEAFSEHLQFEEVYLNYHAMEASEKLSQPVRQGWRLLGGTLTDIVCWCLLSSERSDKMNIDVVSLAEQYDDGVIQERLEEVFDILRNKLIPQTTKKRKKLFRVPSGGAEVINTTEVIKDEQISAIVNLERRLFNFLFQWMQFRVQTDNIQVPLHERFAPLLRLAYHCGAEKVEIIRKHLDAITAASQGEKTKKTVSFGSSEGAIDTTPLLSHKVEVLAEQLTILELEYYRELRLREFLNLAWDKEEDKAPTIRTLIAHYNHTGLWVATEIMKAGSPKMQAKLFAKFVRIAQRLLELRNYATCAQILSGVSHRAIQRLKKLSKQLDWKTLERYESLNDTFDAVSGYANYRNQLSHDPPSVPFLAVHLRTLTLIEEGNPRTLGDDPNILSFARMVMYAEDIAKLHLHDPSFVAFPFEPHLGVLSQLRKRTWMDEEALFAMSEELEPLRGALRRDSLIHDDPVTPEESPDRTLDDVEE